MASLTASRAVVTDVSGVITASAASAVEVGYLSGVTSGIQGQIDAKINLAGGTMTGPLYLDIMNGAPNQAATKEYVDNAMLGLNPKAPVRVTTTAPGTLASDFEDGDTVDGVTIATGDRILIKDQVDEEENGIYEVQASGAPVRTTDADTWAELVEAYVLTEEGTQNAGAGFLANIASSGTINTDPVYFIQFSSSTVYTADGQGIELTGTLFSLELDGSTLSKSSSGLRIASGVETTINAALPNPLTTTGDIIYSSSGSIAVTFAIHSAPGVPATTIKW
jgi:hypothetical protein